MKLQISFDTTDLENTIERARAVAPFADIFEIGTILLYLHGINALQRFKDEFPDKTLLADTKIIDRGKTIVSNLAPSGINWITVMAGTSKNVIHAAATQAHKDNVKVMLDLLDAASLGQSALEAKNLGADALLFHQPYEEEESLTFFDKWDMIKGNTSLPIFVSGKINRETIKEIIPLNPHGIIIGKAITDASNPALEAEAIKKLIDA